MIKLLDTYLSCANNTVSAEAKAVSKIVWRIPYPFRGLLLGLFILIYAHVCFVCMYIYVPCISLLLMKVRRGHWVLLKLELWMLVAVVRVQRL